MTDDPIFDIMLLLLGLVSVAIPVIHVVRFVSKRVRRYLDDRRWERDSKKFHLTEEEIQRMKVRAKKAREEEEMYRGIS